MRLKPPTQTIGLLLGDGFAKSVARLHRRLGVVFGVLGRGASAVITPLPIPVRLVLLLVFLGGGLALFRHGGSEWYLAQADLISKDIEAGIRSLAILGQFGDYARIAFYLAAAMGAVAVLAFVRKRFVLSLLRAVAVLQAAAWLTFMWFVLAFPAQAGEIYQAQAGQGSGAVVGDWQLELWLPWAMGTALVLCVSAVLVVCTWLGSTQEYYTRRAPASPLAADRLIENLRTHGKDTRYRTSLYWPLASCVAYLVVLLVMMFLRGCGWEKDYDVPFGSGTPTVTVVQVKRVKREKPEKLVLNLDSPIIWKRPEPKDIEILKEMEEATDEVYVANRNIGKMGAGGGNKGGWPDGVEGAAIRFIRLKYSGGDWDQDMGHGADYNMLLYFSKITGFKIAPNTEAKEISRLGPEQYRKGKAPRFVYMTGMGNIHVSSKDAAVLRKYCLDEGGMVFADNGGGHFDRSFRNLCRQTFPDKPLVDIPDDDPIYQQPFVFPNGAPPLWHHSGYRAMGVRHEGRWVLYYHQGDINDAWKTGHSGASDAVASRALKLGINIMYYAFTRYYEKHNADK